MQIWNKENLPSTPQSVSYPWVPASAYDLQSFQIDKIRNRKCWRLVIALVYWEHSHALCCWWWLCWCGVSLSVCHVSSSSDFSPISSIFFMAMMIMEWTSGYWLTTFEHYMKMTCNNFIYEWYLQHKSIIFLIYRMR